MEWQGNLVFRILCRRVLLMSLYRRSVSHVLHINQRCECAVGIQPNQRCECAVGIQRVST